MNEKILDIQYNKFITQNHYVTDIELSNLWGEEISDGKNRWFLSKDKALLFP